MRSDMRAIRVGDERNVRTLAPVNTNWGTDRNDTIEGAPREEEMVRDQGRQG